MIIFPMTRLALPVPMIQILMLLNAQIVPDLRLIVVLLKSELTVNRIRKKGK